MPEAIAQNMNRFDVFALGRTEGEKAVVHSVRFQVEGSPVGAVPKESGMHAPIFRRLCVNKGQPSGLMPCNGSKRALCRIVSRWRWPLQVLLVLFCHVGFVVESHSGGAV